MNHFQLQSKQRYDSGESGVFSNSSSCPCGCGKEYTGCIGSGKDSGEDSAPSSLYIPSSYITKKLSEVSSSHPSLTCADTTSMGTTNDKPLDMSKTSSIYSKNESTKTIHGQTASHRDLFPGLYLLVDTALGVHERPRPVQVQVTAVKG